MRASSGGAAGAPRPRPNRVLHVRPCSPWRRRVRLRGWGWCVGGLVLAANGRVDAQARPAQAATAPASAQPTAAQAQDKRERVYMTELGLMVDGARRLIAFSESNVDDRELTKFARPLAERYVETANHMVPPAKIAVVHPHLLLVMENLERA